MKEAFTKADNVLATAAKCITDVINSRGHIIVDFADVCTVMKNGGVAILGKAEVEGENRAQRAIEEALNSPLLNDNDIKGAKWILLNINSAEGDFECSMDELETISNILRERTGEHSDVIMGSGYDDTLGEKIGITLIATGFEGKDPFKKEESKKAEAPIEEKIVMTLAPEAPEAIVPEDNAPAFEDSVKTAVSNEAPVQNSLNLNTQEEDNHFVLDISNEEPVVYSFVMEENAPAFDAGDDANSFDAEDEVNAFDAEEAAEFADLTIEAAATMEELQLAPTMYVEAPEEVSNVFVVTPELEETTEEVFVLDMNETPAVDYGNSFVLNKPANIYSEEAAPETVVNEVVETIEEEVAPVIEEVAPVVVATNESNFQTSFRVAEEEPSGLELVMRETHSTSTPSAQHVEMPLDDSEEQRRKVRERIQKLRNLSFNIGNGNDPSAEFDEVPAYVRRNMDLFGNTLASVENYYSKYTVEQDENNNTQIKTINTFLDGKKPD
jgi:cell division protein FtsZ